MREPETHREEVIGLRLPNGSKIFPPDTFHGRALTSPEGRRAVYESIKLSAHSLGMDEHELLSRYSWVTSSRVIVTVWTDSRDAVPLSEMVYVDEPETTDPDLQSGTPEQ